MERIGKDVAVAILKEAQAGGYLENIPTDEEEMIQQAEYWAEEAIKINKSGKLKGDKTVIAIVNIVNTHRFFTDEPEAKTVDNFFSGVSSIETGLPIPRETKEDPEQMPSDLPSLSDEELRFLSGKYNYYIGRARYVLAHFTNNLANASHLRDDAYRNAYKQTVEEFEEEGKKYTDKIIDMYAREDEEYKRYDKDARALQDNVIAYKALIDIYSSNIDRLSREATIRHNEWERTR